MKTSNFFSKWLLLPLVLLTLSVSDVWAIDASAYKEAKFGSSYNSKGVSSYTDSWSSTYNSFRVDITNGNNNSNGWSYIKFGRKNNTSVGTIITSNSIDKRITKVEITIDALTASKINSIKLYTSANGSSWSSSIGTFTKATGTQKVYIPAVNQSANLYYKIEFDCASGSSNGLITISSVKFYRSSFTVTYNKNGGFGSATDSNSPYDTASVVTTKAANTFTAPSGKEFDGWNTASDGSGAAYAAGKTFTISANTTLYAQWKSAASCDANPTIGTASLNGTFNLSSVGVQCASASAGDNCSLSEYGFVWGTSNTDGHPNKDDNVVTNTGAYSANYTNSLTGSFSTGVTYYYRGYAKNNGDHYGYSSTVQSFTPYQITYNKNNAGAMGSITPQVVNTGGNVTLASSGFSLTGHHIDHWALNSASGTSYNKGATYSVITANAEFYAIWAVNQWTLTWAFAGGSSSETAGEDYTAGGTVNYGTAITKPSNGSMSKTGYDFSGWSSSAITMPDNNLTITAQWTAQKYAITYKDQGGGDFSGTQTSAPSQHTYGTATTLKIPTKTGYTFGGWFTESDCASGAVGNTTSASLGATAYTSAITLYAKWTANTYQVVFNKNGGSGDAMSNQDFTYDAAPQALSSNTYTAPVHKYFIGWNTSSGASTALYTDGQSVSNLTATANGTVMLYAIWKDHTYTNYRTTCSETYDIVLHDNNGGSQNGSAKVADGGKLLTNIVAPTRDGYSVEGYYAEAGTSTKIADASGVLQSDKTGYTDAGGAWTKGDGATLYAKWTATNYTITYEGLEGASNTNPTNYTIETATIVLANPGSREGYTFAGWTCGGSPITQIAVGSTGDKTITATWTPNTYSVRFNKNGGDGSMSPQNFTYGLAQNLTSNGFTAPREKSFGGWTTNSDGTGDFYTNGQEVSNLTSVNGATVDLYAKWVDCDLYTVTLNVNGDTWKTVTQGSCDASIDLSSYQDVPSCGGGYTLVGWSTTNSADPMFDAPAITKTSSYTPESNVTLYAVYSHTAVIGTRIMNTGSISAYDSYIVVASAHNKVMCVPPSTTNLAAATDVVKSADGSKCYVTGNGTPFEIMFSDKSTYWMISKYNSSTGNNWYYYSQSSRNALAWYDEDDYAEWWIYNYIEKYGDWYDAEDYVASSTASSKWSISIDGSGNATISEATNNRIWKYNSTDVKFGAYNSGSYKAVSLYRYDEGGSIYTTQPSMTVYTISKGAETNGTYTISAGVVCSGQAVAVTATPASGYAFGGWESDNGGTFANASAASTTFTPTANTTVTANFVLREQHNITWMVNGEVYTTGTPTNKLYGGDSYSTMTLPTAPADNTLSNACGAVANQFVGWSTTDMGFATGQSAPAKLFTTAAGAGSAYGSMGDADVVFYAVFAEGGSSNYMSRCADSYSITLDKKEGTTDGTAVATEMGSTLDITLAPTYAGHSVEGYYAETGLTTKIAGAYGTLLAGKSGYTDGSGKWINTTSPLTLYTKWTLNSHTLTWNLDGGSISAAGTPAGTIAYGTELVAPTVTKTGYQFNVWSPAVASTMPDEDVTYTATWTADQYAITYKDQGDATYSGSNGGLLPAKHTYGTATALPNGVKAGYRFDGWYLTDECTGDPITSIGATAYTSGPIVLYAKWTASHTFTFSKNGVVDGELTLGQVEGGNVVMPNTTVDCGLWTTFEGWVIGDVAETTTEPATIYKPGDIFVAGNSNQEFKAVYSKHEGDASVYYEKVTSGPKSGTYVMVSSEVSEKYYTTTGWNSSIYSTAEVTVSANGTISAANAASASANVFTIHAGYGVNAGKFAIYDGSKYMASGSSVSRQDAHSYTWELLDGSTTVNGKDRKPAAGAIHSTSATDNCLQYNSSQPRFAMYGNTQKDVFLYRKRVAGTTYYTTAPGSCEVPTKITVSYNDNKANAGDQTIEGMPSGTTIDFTTYPDFASYTIGAAPTNPTGYHFAGWNTQADGNGDDYAAGASVTTFGYRETITLYAQWERVYTVTLYDNGVERTRLTQASAGANVTLPSGNNCGVGSAFTFVGWTDSPVQLNAEPVRPNIVSGAGEWGDDELTDDITLYSVYSKSVDGCDDFAAGVSGAYKMYYDGSKYATTDGTSGSYTGATSGTAEVFYIAYAPSHTGYTIRTSTGFVGWNYNGEELTKGNATPYYWKISGSSSNWVITPEPSAYTRQLKSSDGSKFQLYAAATNGKLLLQQSAMTYYYNTAICEEAQVTFHDGGGAISGMPTTPDGASWNSGTHVLSGLEDCDKITTFPTANYDGWTFIGWSTEDYTNSGKHVTDYAEENASTDEPDGSIIYKTGGNSYTIRGGSVDLYPVFTRFPENEPFDLENGGDYYIYYLKPGTDDGYGDPIRVYAGAYDGDKRYSQTISCTAATTFTFTKDGDVWHIYDKTTGKYVAGLLSEDWLLHANDLSGTLDDWTLTIKSGNQFYASCQGGGRYISFSTSANYFMDYSTTANPGICLPVYLGSCTERIYSSEPSPVPTIDLTGSPMVTSSVGQTVRAATPLTLSGSHLTGATKVTLTGTNLKFATSTTDAPVASLDVAVTSGNVAATNIYVYYTPTATEDGIENVIITATDNGDAPAETKAVVQVRHLPADFVIAAKWGDKWYALPNTCTSSGSSTTGVLIEVDDDDEPTEATSAPDNTKWGLRQTKQPKRITDGGYADRLTFTERGTTSTVDNQQTLYNYNSANVYTYAQWSNYANTNPERYEWIPVTTDFGDYTLTNANDANRILVLRNSDGSFAAQNTDQAYGGKVRLLPATFYEEAPVQIIEWKANSVVVMYTGTETSATTKVGTNSASSAQTLSTHKLTHGIYELTTGQSLASYDGKNLLLTFGSMKKVFEIPVIITGNSTAYSGHEKQDVVIVNGGKLSAAATKYSYHNIYVYGGGKLKIASGTNLGVNNIILRAGGIATSGIGSTPSATYEYVYPQVELRGTLSSTKTNIKYEYITDYDHWYQFCLPFDGTLSSITYPQEYYGDNVTAENTGSWIIKRYAGEVRATGNYDAWKDIETEAATEVTAGHGYIFWGAPKKVSVGGAAKQRQQWGIQRITMPIMAAAATDAETADKNISVDSYSDVEGKSTKPNDQGWNLVGNPYMVNLTDLSSNSMIAGQLVHTETAPWDGKWRNNGDGVRYVTIPDNHFDSYVAKTASVASGEGDFMPGRAFFVQIAEGESTLTFAAANRASLMPARFAQTAQSVDIETGIVMSDESKHDEVNFWIKEDKTAEYEYNADYPKTPNNTNFNIYGIHSHGDLSWIAISPEIAEGSMAIGYQVPTAGEYRLSLSETYVSDKIDQLLVTDHEMSPEITTNLLTEDYVFQVNQAETNNTRFTVSIRLAPQTPTNIGNVPSEGMSAANAKPQKFIYHDKLYILRNGVIYDATGKQVKGGLK